MGRFLLRLLAFTLFLISPSAAQIQNGQFTGFVTDPTGAVVPGARVTVTNLGTGLAVNVATNDSGFYSARELPVGQYRITVEAQGFSTITKTGLTLNAGTIVRVDFSLQVGARSESVEVAGGATPVETQTSRLAETVGAAQIANLPLNGRNVYDLIQLAPGAVNAKGVIFELGANTVVNGVRVNFNGFLINGVSNKGLSGGPANQPIQDTVQEFQLLTLNNSAEFGNSAGSITNLVSKSGTNAFHGSAWWFVRNDIFDANNFFLNREGVEKPALRLNQFGATVGGPIRKDKLFFFAAYQGDRFLTAAPPLNIFVESQQFRDAVSAAFPNSIASLLYENFPPQTTPAQDVFTLNDYFGLGISSSFFTSAAEYLCPDFSSPAIAAQMSALIGVTAQDQTDLMNLGCSSVALIQPGAFDRDLPFLIDSVAVVKSQDQRWLQDNLFHGNEASLRLDYNFSPSDRVFAQYNWQQSTDRFGLFFPVENLRGVTRPNRTTNPNGQFSYIHSFGTTALNELRAGYASNRFNKQASHPGVPHIYLDDSTLSFGAYSGYPNIFKEHIYSFADMVSVSIGKHQLKMGADVRRNQENSHWDVGRASYYFFDALFFAADAPYGQGVGVDPGIIGGRPAELAPNIRHFRNWEFGFYFQDDWKTTRRLTLNLGLRYDLYTRHTELDDLATTFLFGPGENFIDDLQTGAGQVKSASIPIGAPGCDTPQQTGLAQLAGICGPGGFAPAASLGAGDHNNFGPRVGFAWDVFGNGSTSVRGGFGVSYEGTLYNPLSNTRWNLPYYSVNSAFNFLVFGTDTVAYGPQTPGELPRYDGPPDPLNFQGTTSTAAMGNLHAWDPTNPNIPGLTSVVLPEGLRDPYVLNWYAGLQREVLPKLVFQMNYVGTAGRKLFRAEHFNRIPGGRLPPGTCVTDNRDRVLCSQVDPGLNPFGRLNPNFDQIRVWRNVVNSTYHALQVSLRKQMNRGFQLNAHYTWSHSIDGGSSWHNGGTSSNGGSAGDGFTTDFTQPGLDRGNSVFDVRHRLVVNYVWELPFFRERRGLLGAALGGWQMNGIWSFQSGAHWSPFDNRRARIVELSLGACSPNAQGFVSDPANCINIGGDYNLDGINNDRPNAVGIVNGTHDQWANGFNLPADFFTTPCLGCVGNLGRNRFVGPGFWAADISAFKTFRLSDRMRLQFRAEAFNLFNRANFKQPGNNTFPPTNRITNPNFGQAGGTFNPRNLQFGLKLSF